MEVIIPLVPIPKARGFRQHADCRRVPQGCAVQCGIITTRTLFPHRSVALDIRDRHSGAARS